MNINSYKSEYESLFYQQLKACDKDPYIEPGFIETKSGEFKPDFNSLKRYLQFKRITNTEEMRKESMQSQYCNVDDLGKLLLLEVEDLQYMNLESVNAAYNESDCPADRAFWALVKHIILDNN